MRIIKAELAISAASPRQFPAGGLPEIAFVGRSNVGKSSLLNNLLGRRGLARTSSQPGKTRLFNFYLINDRFYFVDLPGYGYARVSRAERQRWRQFIDQYLKGREPLRCVLQLIDIRHEPQENDRNMIAWLRECNLPVVIAATKADKIARGRWQQHLARIRRCLALEPGTSLVPFSSVAGDGRDELWQLLGGFLEN
ncbi:MAG: ribosome biogenesis GTP-binding protein YihA/YsxC [bacterium]